MVIYKWQDIREKDEQLLLGEEESVRTELGEDV
jgi:hypothetical protein